MVIGFKIIGNSFCISVSLYLPSLNPIENVLIGELLTSCAIAVTIEESVPPLKNVPIGTSLINLFLIDFCNKDCSSFLLCL